LLQTGKDFSTYPVNRQKKTQANPVAYFGGGTFEGDADKRFPPFFYFLVQNGLWRLVSGETFALSSPEFRLANFFPPDHFLDVRNMV